MQHHLDRLRGAVITDHRQLAALMEQPRRAQRGQRLLDILQTGGIDIGAQPRLDPLPGRQAQPEEAAGVALVQILEPHGQLGDARGQRDRDPCLVRDVAVERRMHRHRAAVEPQMDDAAGLDLEGGALRCVRAQQSAGEARDAGRLETEGGEVDPRVLAAEIDLGEGIGRGDPRIEAGEDLPVGLAAGQVASRHPAVDEAVIHLVGMRPRLAGEDPRVGRGDQPAIQRRPFIQLPPDRLGQCLRNFLLCTLQDFPPPSARHRDISTNHAPYWR
ncbi:hypothetical protein [Mangrovicoccus ximenensis]|uniref:hypothetical protein n=1 Tax=Mangrovicoccus ximenensis TaxID=1911570 RepID=UPI000D38B62D|nr:hypothetical protein [Mangrovicoccus ximenensis]